MIENRTRNDREPNEKRTRTDREPIEKRTRTDREPIENRTRTDREPIENRTRTERRAIRKIYRRNKPKKSLKAHALKLFTNKFYKCVNNYFTFPTLIKYSAICTALRAAPLRIWSLTSQRVKPLGFAKSLRIRPT